MSAAAKGPRVLVGCGILGREIAFLVEKNGWPVAPRLLPSALHTDFLKLGSALQHSLKAHGEGVAGVFYGACHPLMDAFLEQAGTSRTPGQNCIEIYLGREIFDRELAQGAFFLFEEWAHDWDKVMALAMGDNPTVIREILASAHSHLLAIRTPCSGDFTREAEEVARRTGLELRWIDAGLERLEETLAVTLGVAAGGNP